MELTAKERAQVKKVSRELLQTLKAEKLALDWRKRQHILRRSPARLTANSNTLSS